MTLQTSHSFMLQGSRHEVAGVCGEGLFSPFKHGFKPFQKDTACFHGFLCTYALAENRLVLEGLEINHGSSHSRMIHPEPPPEFGGHQPIEQAPKARFLLAYEGMDIPISFTGGLLVASGFIMRLYSHIGFHPAWKYEKVFELSFTDGLLASQRDVSREMRAVRDQIPGSHAPSRGSEERAHVDSLMDRIFSFKYGL